MNDIKNEIEREINRVEIAIQNHKMTLHSYIREHYSLEQITELKKSITYNRGYIDGMKFLENLKETQ